MSRASISPAQLVTRDISWEKLRAVIKNKLDQACALRKCAPVRLLISVLEHLSILVAVERRALCGSFIHISPFTTVRRPEVTSVPVTPKR